MTDEPAGTGPTSSSPAPAGSPRPRAASTRRRAVAAVLVLAAAVLLASLPTWVDAPAASVLGEEVLVAVPGSQAAPGVPAAGLALVAAGLAAALVGRIGRWFVVATVVLASVVVVVAAVGVLAAPADAAAVAATQETGVPDLTGPATASVVAWATALLGLVGVLVGVWLARSATGWSVTSRRHEVAGGAASTSATPDGEGTDPDDADLWDAQSAGEDRS